MNNTQNEYYYPHLWHGAWVANHASQGLQMGRAKLNEEGHKQDCSHECAAEETGHLEGSEDVA